MTIFGEHQSRDGSGYAGTNNDNVARFRLQDGAMANTDARTVSPNRTPTPKNFFHCYHDMLLPTAEYGLIIGRTCTADMAVGVPFENHGRPPRLH